MWDERRDGGRRDEQRSGKTRLAVSVFLRVQGVVHVEGEVKMGKWLTCQRQQGSMACEHMMMAGWNDGGLGQGDKIQGET